MLDFGFATFEEVCKELAARLKAQRLAQLLTQADLAGRSGVSLGTVKNLEAKGQSSLESFIRIVLALGLADQLAPLFTLQVKTIAQMEQAEQSQRKRVRKSRAQA